MFRLAISVGIYSYIIFSLGLLGLLYKLYIVLVTFAYIVVLTYFNREVLIKTFLQYINVLKKSPQIVKRKPFLNFLIILIVLQAIANFIGVLGPELGFDALWYHLTLPKIYLIDHYIDYIPGGLFYYSAMSKLTEMLYVVGLAFGSEIYAKLIHFSFGDFYDTDGYFSKTIKQGDNVLLYGFHNLYYVNFPFVDSSYVKKGDMFNYIAVQANSLPERFKTWNLTYYNNKTKVRLYSIGGLKWVY